MSTLKRYTDLTVDRLVAGIPIEGTSKIVILYDDGPVVKLADAENYKFEDDVVYELDYLATWSESMTKWQQLGLDAYFNEQKD